MLSRRRDAGFTLVELLISVSVLGVVLTAIASVSLVAARTATSADTRLRESNDLLRAATYFGADVQGAQSAAAGTVPRCGTDARAVVELLGQDFADDATLAIGTTVVAYVVRTVADPAGTRRELHRLACTAPTAAPAYPLVPATDVPVVLRLSAATPTATCGAVACSAAFTRVDLAVQETGGLAYTLTGRRRTTP